MDHDGWLLYMRTALFHCWHLTCVFNNFNRKSFELIDSFPTLKSLAEYIITTRFIIFWTFCRPQNSRIFCERGRPSICERKAVWSECENGEREWGVWGSRASLARIALKALRAFDRKRLKTTVLQSKHSEASIPSLKEEFRVKNH